MSQGLGSPLPHLLEEVSATLSAMCDELPTSDAVLTAGSITHSNSDIIGRSSFQASGREDKFIKRDRKIAHPLPRRVINRVSNCCRDPGYTDFASPASSNWIENGIRLTDKMDIDVRHVGVSSY